MSGPTGSAGLAYYLCSYAAGSSGPAVSGLSPSSGTTAGGELVTLSGSGFQSSGAADVAGVQVGAWQAPTSAVHVLGPSSLTLTLPPASQTVAAHSPTPQDGAGPVAVIVTLTDGRSSAPGPASTFEYFDTGAAGAVPSVTGVIPYGGAERTPAPVTILGADFKGAREVSFGGVKAAGFKLLSDSRILVTPPPYTAHTACAPLPASGVYASENAANDVCQAQVLVRDATGTSATAAIRPPFEGAPVFAQDGALEAPSGCDCEVYPAPSEFDYAPAPSITSVSTSQGPSSLASETGGTLVTIHGTGLNRATLDYASFDAPGLEASMELEALDQEIAFVSGTEIQIVAPAIAEAAQTATVEPTSVPLSVRTLAGESAPAPVQYAGVPRVSGVQSSASKRRLEGAGGAPDTGGTPIVVKGKGLSGQVTLVRFDDSQSPLSQGTNYTVTASSDTRLSTNTVSQNPALADVQACTVTGCSAATKADLLFLYPPGQPDVEALTPHSGSAAGATNVLVHGQNLGCPLAVAFGGVQAESFSAIEALLACGSTSELDAVSPPGSADTKVPVTVSTVESYFSGESDAPSKALFTYTNP